MVRTVIVIVMKCGGEVEKIREEKARMKLPKKWIEDLFWVVVSNILNFHPYLGKWSNLTNIFQKGWNHQLV